MLVLGAGIASRRARSVLARDGFVLAATTPEMAAAARPAGIGAVVLSCEAAALRPELTRLRALLPDVSLVVVCAAGDRTAIRTAVAAGADAYVEEPRLEQALVPAVRAAIAGLTCIPREGGDVFGRPAFSHREKQVLLLVARGFKNAEIASRLYLAESTVKTHLSSSFRKLGVRTRRDAAAIVLDPERGLEFRMPDDAR